ncbi:hypothetical protein SG34_032845 [Thalassomonas viridans]|uniref:Uncharacterized protein n=1 Tax=Thalassomonas viridans TaxID=137584 RepID=A0AAF0CCU9_9GAMM|nr:hypothetical protein [Thalassomonas viridans]WDE08698.1 hypothetical protein SG34_032845 [Thalassomonas viridans]
MSTTFYITDKLFTDLDTINVTTEGEVENATSYGTFNNLETINLLTREDVENLNSRFTSTQEDYTLDEYISLLWEQTKNGLENFIDPSNGDYILRVQEPAGIFSSVLIDVDGIDRLNTYKALIENNSAAELQALVSTRNKVSKDIEGSAEALLARAGIDTQEEARQLVNNIIAEYIENGLSLEDGQSHIFKTTQQINPTDLYHYAGRKNSPIFGLDPKLPPGLIRYREDQSLLTFEVTLDYDEILHAALEMALDTTITDDENLSDSLFALLYQNYSHLTDNTQIREAYNPQKLYRNLIPDAFINNNALEEATADAMAITGLDLYQMEYNYNQRHPNDKLYLTPKLWNGEGRAYRAIRAAAEEWKSVYPEYPGTIDVAPDTWDEFTAWVRTVDPERKYFTHGGYYDNNYTVSPAEYPIMQRQLDKFIIATGVTIDKVEEHILMKDRFMQAHREYLNIKERQYKATAKELSNMNKMIDAAREWHEWIGVFERKNNKSANLQQADAEKYQEFIKWITSSDVASPSANDYRPYIDWANDYDNGDTILNDEELTTLYTDIGDYLKSLENRTSLVTVDANEFLTRFNEGLEFLSMVLKRIQTTLENVLRNI